MHLKNNTGQGDHTIITVSPDFTKTSDFNTICQNYFVLPILSESISREHAFH